MGRETSFLRNAWSVRSARRERHHQHRLDTLVEHRWRRSARSRPARPGAASLPPLPASIMRPRQRIIASRDRNPSNMSGSAAPSPNTNMVSATCPRFSPLAARIEAAPSVGPTHGPTPRPASARRQIVPQNRRTSPPSRSSTQLPTGCGRGELRLSFGTSSTRPMAMSSIAEMARTRRRRDLWQSRPWR